MIKSHSRILCDFFMKGIQDMDILIKNANLISMDTNREKIEKNMDNIRK